MRLRIIVSVCLILCFAAALIAQGDTDPLSGVWFGDYGTNPRDREQVQVVFRWDGKTLIGFVRTGEDPMDIENGMFDPKTGAVHMEVTVPGDRFDYHYIVDGKLDKDTIIGTWHTESAKGDFTIKKI